VKGPAGVSGIVLNNLALVSLVVVVLAVGALYGLRMRDAVEVHRIPESLVEYVLQEPIEMTPFTLLGFDGEEFGISRLEGKWSFIFFGYTNCPDVCPVTMANLATVFRKLEARSRPMSNIQGIFISVDEARDTPEILKQYVLQFDPRFKGLSGTKPQLDNFTRQLGVLYYIDPENPDENYPVSHNSSLFLIDPKARHFARFAMPHVPDEIVDVFTQIVRHYEVVEGE